MTARTALSAAAVRAALGEVPDPEIPVISIVDLGLVDVVEVGPERIRVELLPTFVGCPALDMIRTSVVERLAGFDRPVEVEFGYRVPWTSDRISEKGRERLRASGFAPPLPAAGLTAGSAGAVREVPVLVSLDAPVPCPYCGSPRTVLDNAFGPTACRSIRYCTACRQPFEQFKTI